MQISHNDNAIAIWASKMIFRHGKWRGFVTLLSLLSQ